MPKLKQAAANVPVSDEKLREWGLWECRGTGVSEAKVKQWATPVVMATEQLQTELRALDAKLPREQLFALDAGRATDAIAFLEAAKRGDAVEVARLLKHAGASPDQQDEMGSTVMHLAAARNYVGVMEALSEGGARLDIDNVFGRTPLMISAVMGSTEAVDWLLLQGADWRREDEGARTAQDWAKEGGAAAARAVESLQVWVTTNGNKLDKATMERERRTAFRKGCEQLAAEFLAAVRAGDVAEVALLLAEEDIDPNGGDPRPTVDRPTSGATALHVAAQRNHTAMMDALVAAEVAIRHRLGEIKTQQAELLESKNEKVAAAKDAKEAGELNDEAQLLAEAGEIGERLGRLNEEETRLRKRLASGELTHLDRLDSYDWTPVMAAAHGGCAEAVEWLLKKGADWRRVDGSEMSALDRALAKGKLGAAAATVLEQWILKHGNAQERAPMKRQLQEERALLAEQRRQADWDQDTALMVSFLAAAKVGNCDEITRLMAEEGAGVNVADEHGVTALGWAAWFNQTTAMDVLLEAGCDLEIADGDGYTALMAAAGSKKRSGCAEAVEWLLEKGADWERTDDFGRTALQQAGESGPAKDLLEQWAAARCHSRE